MATLRIKYSLTPEAVKAEFVKSGNQDSGRVLVVEASGLTPAQRAKIVELNLSLPCDEPIYEYDLTNEDPISTSRRYDSWKEFDHELSFDEAIEALKASFEQKKKAEEIHVAYLASEREKQEKERAESARERAEEKAREEAEEKARADARADWIAKHGSDHLKRACDAGHTCTRLYYTERATKEYPGAVLDFNDHAVPVDRSCPTVAALDLRDKLLKKHPDAKIEIIWLKNFPLNEVGLSEEDLYEREQEFEPHEAIRISDPAYEASLYVEIEKGNK